MINQTTQMPTEGQFIAIWEYDGKLWSNTCKAIRNEVFIYSNYLDNFYESLDIPCEAKNVIYLIT